VRCLAPGRIFRRDAPRREHYGGRVNDFGSGNNTDLPDDDGDATLDPDVARGESIYVSRLSLVR
jgi:hypothetical protein